MNINKVKLSTKKTKINKKTFQHRRKQRNDRK